jgi:ABC transport system ATP-binding/permease protein
MALLSLLGIDLNFGGPLILDQVNLQINPGERVCLVGRNGAGKSSLLRVISGETKPDSGSVFQPDGAIATRLTQEIPADVHGTVYDVIAAGLRDPTGHEEDWERDVRLEDLLETLRLNPALEFSSLSGGLKRRTLLARALAAQPNVLLLDEPTNHLDVESILWMENFLLESKLTLLFVTHDRAFLRRLATRIIELDRGRLSSWACDYNTYLVRKQEVLEAEEKQQAQFDKKLAQEEAWVRKGVRAQRTRNQSRINQLLELRAERRARRERTGSVTLRLAEAERTGVKVIEAENLTFAWPGQPALVRDFSTTIIRGDKIGLIGPNGAGKTTLIKLLLGQIAPTAGGIKHGTKLEVVYFDQLRAQIDDTKTVAENIDGGNDTVTIEGRTRNVISYLQDFLFEPARARTPARVLSGGERNRLLLARLFTKPANVLVMDEPTNDLDAETLELLEDLLVQFKGTLLVISHDREFLDNVVTSSLVFEGEGKIGDYVGGYSDWIRQRPAAKFVHKSAPARLETSAVAKPAKKITEKQRQELEALPAQIESLEREQSDLASQLADPAFYKRDPAAVLAAKLRLETLEGAHAKAFARWEELDAALAAGQK